MAIYKLGDIFNISSGSTPNTKNENLWKPELLWYTPIDLKNDTHTERKIADKISNVVPPNTNMISSRAPIGYVGKTKETAWHSQGIKGFINDESKVLNNYFYYWLISNVKIFQKLGVGSTFSEISTSVIKSIQIDLPSLEEQQKIIDIIEPFEELISFTQKNISVLEKILEIYSNTLESNLKLSSLVTFEKGKIVKSSEFSTKNIKNLTGFIDVRSLLPNNEFSKYVSNSPNSFFSDILLSLDGTPGRICYWIEGFNGYVYNVKSDKISKGQILIDLLNKLNKKIIVENSQGTTIKHASRAKDKMLHFDSSNVIVDPIFNNLLLSRKILFNLLDIKKKLIDLLVK
ncbi:hypothetical protein CG006_01670 [Mesoplasma florum]|uniref:restriction endonuclease subunit S n=1 Tax=Mesoplasma florum TaxID=2151 RepID=UPI000D03DAEA|nr:restriction endonuclease subunit S [Mesoplasma florum]AVN63686.1 hypothetical protein CG006_01670 [Mesoplasma florum]